MRVCGWCVGLFSCAPSSRAMKLSRVTVYEFHHFRGRERDFGIGAVERVLSTCSASGSCRDGNDNTRGGQGKRNAGETRGGARGMRFSDRIRNAVIHIHAKKLLTVAYSFSSPLVKKLE